jgi:hypothetical protein
VETFTRVQLLRHSKSAGGLETARTAERGGRGTARSYLLRGLVRCGISQRTMLGATLRIRGVLPLYRLDHGTGSAMLVDHPKTVNLGEDLVVESINSGSGGCSPWRMLIKRSRNWSGCKAAGLIRGVRDAATLRLSDAEATVQALPGGYRCRGRSLGACSMR